MPRKAAAPRAATTRKRTAAPLKTATSRRVATTKTPAAKKAAPAKRTPDPRKPTALRVVGPDEQSAEAPKPLTLTQAAEAGDERAQLVAMRKLIAQALDSPSTHAKELSSLSIRLIQINRDIQLFDARAAEEAAHGDNEDIDETFNPEAL